MATGQKLKREARERDVPGAQNKTAGRKLRPAEAIVVDRQGFEPWTLGLRVPCSTS